MMQSQCLWGEGWVCTGNICRGDTQRKPVTQGFHFSLKMAVLGEFIALCCVDCFGSLLV